MSEIEDKINELSREFDQRCFNKHQLGEEKYGPGTWLGVDTLEHALDEMVDMANYIRMTYIKIRMLQEGIARIQTERQTAAPIAGKEMIGKETLLQGGIPG